jgi:hypothetical protein
MANEPSMKPYGGGKVSGSTKVSGKSGGGDPTNQPGQYPPEGDNNIFGGPLPSGTGAPGTAGGAGGGDVTAEPGQLSDGLTGVTDAEITETGAPGTATSPNDSDVGETAISYTRPGSYLSGTYQSDTTNEDIDGPGSITEANDQGYGTGGPQLPGLKGNEPLAGGGRYQPGAGRVLRGGRAVR